LQQPSQIGHTLVVSALLGFAYWLLLGITSSLGQAGTLPPLLAAWATNAIYMAVGIAFLFFQTAFSPDSR
jgi:lipopolysaccharide export LptBFGC system permease protein LptF